MNILKKIVIIIGIAIILRFIVAWDLYDRESIYSRTIPKKDKTEFFRCQSFEKMVGAFEKNFNNPKWSFPKGSTKLVKLYENKLLVSRITSKTLSEKHKTKIIDFLNNSENFSWGETTWSLKEAEYILRFYNSDKEEIGKVWLCLKGCGMTKSIPFSPNMKFGGLSQVGKNRIAGILKLIKK